MTTIGLVLGLVVTASRVVWGNEITTATVVLVAILLIAGFQFSLFGMWLDREENDRLG
jgi:hypothetical protein